VYTESVFVYVHACRPMYADMHECMHVFMLVEGRDIQTFFVQFVDCRLPIPHKKTIKKKGVRKPMSSNIKKQKSNSWKKARTPRG
jgi:hypothetical protein